MFVSTLVLSSHCQPLLDLTDTSKAQILLLEGRDTGTVSFKSLGTKTKLEMKKYLQGHGGKSAVN